MATQFESEEAINAKLNCKISQCHVFSLKFVIAATNFISMILVLSSEV